MPKLDDTDVTRPAWGPGVRRPLRGLAPFAAISLIAWIAVLVGSTIDWPLYGISVAVVLAAVGFGIFMARQDQLTLGTVLGALGFVAAVGLLRSSAGGINSSVSGLSMLPVFQTALYLRSRVSLAVVVAGTVGMYVVPLAFIGGVEYPASGYRGALLSVALSAIIGGVTQELVADVRHGAHEARQRARMLVAVNGAVHRLYDSPNVRTDVCETVRDIGDAVMVAMYEPAPNSGQLVCTATTMPDILAPIGYAVARDSAPDRVFAEGRELLIAQPLESQLGNADVWRAGGSPSTVLYQPLLRGEERLGVLAVGWNEEIDPESPRVVVAALLAHEAAAVIGRADVINQLTDEAHTDPLTGLPNRRAWEARLLLSIVGRQPLFVVMLDIDHFKQYNDTHGHPAGDQLLREAASAWRAAMRATDFLARIGGEEFAMLIPGDDVEMAKSVVERLRAAMPLGQTCSAGVALRNPGEALEQVVVRADEALYKAKAAGRDRSCVDLVDVPEPSALAEVPATDGQLAHHTEC